MPDTVAITATDLNQPMIDFAKLQTRSERIQWEQADAQDLPFPDQTFDVVVCQFGMMFFPDKDKAYREALRVLKPGGRFFSMFGTASRPLAWFLFSMTPRQRCSQKSSEVHRTHGNELS